MANPTIFTDGYFALTTATGSSTYTEVDGTKEVRMPISREEVDDAAMDDDINAMFPGRMNAPISAKLRQDFTASTGNDVKFWTLLNAKTAVRCKIRATDAAVSTTNPSYIFNKVRVYNITPVSGAHGEALVNEVELRVSSGGTVTRSTST